MEADPDEIATIITAIGNHDESTAFPVNAVAAALIIADKTDVRSNRVRNTDTGNYDIHDRVNYSVKRNDVTISSSAITLDIDIDTDFCPVVEYFEIFLERMLLCRKAADKLGCSFVLLINGQRII
jgi:hypothetical protein